MTYIVAEIGQNHNGSVDTAHALIEACAVPIVDAFGDKPLPGVDAVKLTKRDLEYEATRSFMAKEYDSPHAYGDTYGEHRAALELTYDEIAECYHHAVDLDLGFVITLCAPTCVEPVMARFRPDYFKVASRDLTNGPLLEVMARTRVPIILSTGMATSRQLADAIETVVTSGGAIGGILHCLSQYPAAYDRLNLRSIDWLRKKYGHYTIGFSDHSIGIAMAPVAVALGAEIIEKHVSLSRAGKGSDHAGSLEPDGLRRMVRDIRNTERALGFSAMYADPASEPARLKLERSICAARPIRAGETVDESNTMLLSPGIGYCWSERMQVYGKTARTDIPAKELVLPEHLCGQP